MPRPARRRSPRPPAPPLKISPGQAGLMAHPRPHLAALAAALGVSRHTWLRRAAGVGSLSASQLQAAHRLLDNAAPWLNKS